MSNYPGGEAFSWENLTVRAFGRDFTSIRSLSYTEDQPVTQNVGKGSYANSYTRGAYTGQGSFSLEGKEYEALVDAVQVTTGIRSILKAPPFEIIRAFLPVGSLEKSTKTLCGVLFTSATVSASSSDGSAAYYDLNFIFSSIK